MKTFRTLSTLTLCLLCTQAKAAPHPLAAEDPAEARQAISTWITKGKEALPELRKLSKSGDPRLQKRAKEVIGGITGHWGSEVDLIWKRSMQDAIGKDKPIVLLNLFGNLSEEFC